MVSGADNALHMSPALRAALVEHAFQGDPDEVCGILAGHGTRVARVCPVRNTADVVTAERGVFRDRSSGVATAGSKPVHYYMDPRDQLRVYSELDDADLDVVGYYHSHTHTEARPSPTDIRLAVDLAAVYLLVGLEDRANPSVRAWRIHKESPEAETGTLEELSILLDD